MSALIRVASLSLSSSRISSASSRPKRDFKSKSIRSSIEALDSNQHNGLSYSSSLKSTGTPSVCASVCVSQFVSIVALSPTVLLLLL